MHEIATPSRGLRAAGWQPPDVVVGRTGTATIAWDALSGSPGNYDETVRTTDDPPAPRDPQDPARGFEGSFPQWSDYLGIDATDAQTLVYQADSVLGSMADVDVVLSDRAPGGGWSRSPTRLMTRKLTMEAQLAVNASGAAVVMWSEGSHLYASHRDAARAGWTSPERVPIPEAFTVDVDIDDAGRVLLVYDVVAFSIGDRVDRQEGVWAMRRTPTGGWGKRRRLGGPDTEVFSTALGAGGVAVVTYGRVEGWGDARRVAGPKFTSRMSPAGTWGAPVRQWKGLDFAADVDAQGRALLTGWDRTDRYLIGRWSGPEGRWRKPFVVAADVPHPTMLKVAVNRRGDALVAWGAKGWVGEIWARYKPAERTWTKPAQMTSAESKARWFDAAIGECGHVAIAWTTRKPHQVQVRRASPIP